MQNAPFANLARGGKAWLNVQFVRGKIQRTPPSATSVGLPYQRRRYAIMLYELSLVGVAVILIVALFIAAFAAS
jgi:hypothetical protein